MGQLDGGIGVLFSPLRQAAVEAAVLDGLGDVGGGDGVPAIYDFLGYAPWQPPETFAAWLRQARRGMGMSRRKLAARIGVDPTTVDRWERGQGDATAESMGRLRQCLGSENPSFPGQNRGL